jgi:Tol biopolymer transport system component
MKCGSLTVSPDGKRIAYVVGESGLLTGKVSVFVDEVALPYGGSRRAVSRGRSYAGVAVPLFSPDSQRVAYAVRRAGEATIVTEENEGTYYERIGSPVFSPDGRRIAYSAERGSRFFVVLDRVEGDAYEKVTAPTFSPDSQRIAYAAWRDKQAFLIVNGARVDDRSFAEVGDPAFSADGRHLAYKASLGKVFSVVLDGVEGPQYDEIGRPGFSRDGRLAYAARRKGIPFIVIEGAEPLLHPEYKQVGDPVFSPDGRRVAYWAFDGKKYRVVVDDAPGEPCDQIGKLVFSPDGRHLAFDAGVGNKWSGRKWRLVVDGVDVVEGPQYGGWVFERPDLLVSWGQRRKSTGRLLRESLKLSFTEASVCGGIVRREVRILEGAPPRR